MGSSAYALLARLQAAQATVLNQTQAFEADLVASRNVDVTHLMNAHWILDARNNLDRNAYSRKFSGPTVFLSLGRCNYNNK